MPHASGFGEPTRREFLHSVMLATGAVIGTSPQLPTDRRCILIHLTGGPSHIDTFDPKPEAPAEYRGPFRSIPTAVPGVRFSELFPRLAARADRFAVIRSLNHTDAPVHDTGRRML